MKCPQCNQQAACTDSRPTKENSRRRRWECAACGIRFTTLEQIVITPGPGRGTIRTAAAKQLREAILMDLRTKLHAEIDRLT